MKSSLQLAIRDRLTRSFVGPIMIAVLFYSGVIGIVGSVGYPVRLALVLLINRLIHQAHVDTLPLNADSWRQIMETVAGTPVSAICFLILGAFLAYWMFGKSKSSGAEQ